MITEANSAGSKPASRSITETGHAVNLDNFNLMVQVLAQMDRYRPSDEDLVMPSLLDLALRAETALDDATLAETNYDNATGDRSLLFRTMKQVAGKAQQALRASKATAPAKAHAQTIMNKLRGTAPKTRKQDVTGSNPEAEHAVSNSQQSYEQQIEHFKKLRDLLETQPGYHPLEPELTREGLATLQEQLKEQHALAGQRIAQWRKARQLRNEIFYAPVTGLVDVALRIKSYIASVFGNTSPEYRQVRKLYFRTFNK